MQAIHPVKQVPFFRKPVKLLRTTTDASAGYFPLPVFASIGPNHNLPVLHNR
jgi:hypothetical protein